MEISNVRPVLDRVIVKKLKAEEMQGVLLLADTAQKEPNKGVVVAVGPGAIGSNNSYLPMLLKAGDTVAWGEFAGQKDLIGGEEYWIINYGDILYVL